MDRLLAEIATALVAPQANTAALERLDKQFNKKMSNSRDPIREGLDIISPAVFVQGTVVRFLHFIAARGSPTYDALRTPACAAAAAAAAARADTSLRAGGAYAADGGGYPGVTGRKRVLQLNRVVREIFQDDTPHAVLPAVAAVLRTPGAVEALLRAGLLPPPSEQEERGGGLRPEPGSLEGDHLWPFLSVAHVVTNVAEEIDIGALQPDADSRAALAAWAEAQPRVAPLFVDVLRTRLAEGGVRAEAAVHLAALLLGFGGEQDPEAPVVVAGGSCGGGARVAGGSAG
ncbi:hypothetical protein MNEG_6576 [Monoraphidium neglectum]|uniref:Uncharacterized protein n=1 Tax=Monoraphidium neglectum TaxID=145388 RepID=A0A0D2JQL5_9CHLO|nr:hypothetical protein MNEG_6576 [Monoraphidium neglectum]KIZ01383.1 hypothetical protein MNEG_6576 [Monoraphidium neglectum]|eukprot:XP_013900402.1 hypothetical protein MNEG_6576 [Monoraphidium neglectum]